MIDTHTHIYESKFNDDRAETIARAQAAGVDKMLLPSTCLADIETVRDVCAQYPGICFPLYGLHPTEMGDNPVAEAEQILAFAEQNEPYVGVGEIGLDLYWDKNRRKEQEEVFLFQMRYAYNHDKPVSIHCREAVWLLMDLLRELKGSVPAGSLHCYAGSMEEAVTIAAKWPQLMFGFGGSSTYKNSKVAQIAAALPRDRILIETDAPYLTPMPYRGKRNEPQYVALVAQKIAEAAGTDVAEIQRATTDNAERLFFR